MGKALNTKKSETVRVETQDTKQKIWVFFEPRSGGVVYDFLQKDAKIR